MGRRPGRGRRRDGLYSGIPRAWPGVKAEVRVSVMDPSVSGSALATLGEDLFLLSIRARDGKLMTGGRIDSALLATELIRLAAAGRAWIAGGRIVARDRTANGDAELDAALLSLAGAAFPPRPETWVGLPRRGIRAAYAARLLSAGVLRLEPSRVLGGPRYQVTNASRVAAARSQLDAVTQSSGAHAAGRPPAACRPGSGRLRPGGPSRPGQRDRAGRRAVPGSGRQGPPGTDGPDRAAASHRADRGGKGRRPRTGTSRRAGR